MISLAIDTCLAACQAALTDGERVLAVRSEPMTRGHQERLAPMVAELMAEAGVSFSAVERLAVTVGPGSFTGLRVGLAFAKGLRLALGVPAAGVGTLEALAASSDQTGLVAAVVDARREQFYLQIFQDGQAIGEPQSAPVEFAADRLRAHGRFDDFLIVGPGAARLAELAPGARALEIDFADPLQVARLGAARAPEAALAPLYLRAPDARPMAIQ